MKSLSLEKIKLLLSKYNIPFCPTELAKSKEDALKIAELFGYPVVLKIAGSLHKTEKGLVKANIKNREELQTVWDEIVESSRDIESEGILIQKYFSGIEIITGMKRDEQFGPVLMFGVGGILVEIIKDVTFRIAPIEKKDAFEMFKEIKGNKLLLGYRGQDAVDKNVLAELLVSLSELSLSEEDISEIDLNPVIANKEGIWVVDPRFLFSKKNG